MNAPLRPRRRASACPHDCPSTCALEVEVLDGRTVGRFYGAADNSYTAGVICAKVARYAERVHNPDRLTRPLVRTGPKGSGAFAPIGWDEALDRIAEQFDATERRHGPAAVWPYFYAGTMGLVMRDGIERLRLDREHNCRGRPSVNRRNGQRRDTLGQVRRMRIDHRHLRRIEPRRDPAAQHRAAHVAAADQPQRTLFVDRHRAGLTSARREVKVRKKWKRKLRPDCPFCHDIITVPVRKIRSLTLQSQQRRVRG